jgi:hypothetical protein
MGDVRQGRPGGALMANLQATLRARPGQAPPASFADKLDREID